MVLMLVSISREDNLKTSKSGKSISKEVAGAMIRRTAGHDRQQPWAALYIGKLKIKAQIPFGSQAIWKVRGS